MVKQATTLYLILLLAIVSFLGDATSLKAQERGGLYTYTYTVKENGWIDITTKFQSNTSGTSWVLVPKFREYNLTVLSGEILNISIDNNTKYYFYSNFSFSYLPNTTLEMSWSYRFGALIVEPNGAFFSTQIGFCPEDDAEVIIKLPSQFVPSGVEPKGYKIEEEGEYSIIRYELDGVLNNTLRVLISFKVEDGQPFLEKHEGKLVLKYPSRYEDLAENITTLYRKILPEVMKYTAMKEELPIRVKLFVPGSMEEITTLGYTGPRYTSDIITQGEINLNLMLVRMPQYELPNTFIHELLHQYMQAAGLSVDLRWVHEGLAQYLSAIIVEEALGLKVPRDRTRDREVIAYTNGNFSFLVKWKGGGLPGDPGLYYAASEILMKKFAEEYGGSNVYAKFFSIVRGKRIKIGELSELVRYLSEAAGKDVSEFFKSYGINVEEYDTRALTLVEAAERYANTTLWFNPLSKEALRVLEGDKSREGALKAISLIILGLLLEALTISLAISFLYYTLSRKKITEGNGEATSSEHPL